MLTDDLPLVMMLKEEVKVLVLARVAQFCCRGSRESHGRL
jgi:hypothetical protein